MKKRIFIALLVFCQILIGQKRTVKVSDLTKLQQVTNLAISPDDKNILFTVKSIVKNKDNKDEFDYQTHLFLKNLSTNTQTQLTFGDLSVASPIWVDADHIAFNRLIGTSPQIFLLSLKGGEAKPITQSKKGVSNPVVSPDGSKIVFTQSFTLADLVNDSLVNPKRLLPNWSIEKTGFSNDILKVNKQIKANPDGNIEEIRAYLAKDIEDKKAKVINRLNFQGEATTEPEMSFNQIFMVNINDGSTKNLAFDFGSHNQISFLDADHIAAVVPFDDTVHPDREQRSKLIKINIHTGLKSDIFKLDNYSIQDYAFNSKGDLVLNLSVVGKLAATHLYLLPKGKTIAEKIDFDRNINALKWSKTGDKLYFNANSNGGVPLYSLDIKTKAIKQLTDVNSGISVWDIGQNALVFNKTMIKNPSEIYVSDLSGANQKALTTINQDLMDELQISEPEKGSFKNELGQDVEYWIMKPANFDQKKKYPMLLNMHGGPTAMWGPGEQSMWHEFQYFAAQGYGIVYANPRGSSGYGAAFQQANFQDWGTGPASEVLKALDIASKATWVDTSRLVLTGGSYAGYLTAWIVGHDHRFKAAFSQRGVYDLKTFMGEGNAWRLTPNYFGWPWAPEDQTKIEANSPINYVQNIRTPLLIKHSENDLRTGVIQSEMLYKSLKILKREVEYVRMPGGTHELSRTGNVRQRIDRMLRMHEFFSRYISFN